MKNELVRVQCPSCGGEIEVRDEWNGRKVKCPYCEDKFMLEFAEDEAGRDDPRQWVNQELQQRILRLASKVTSNKDTPLLLEIDEQIKPLEIEAWRRVSVEKKKADDACLQKIPAWLKIAKGLFLKFRRRSDSEFEATQIFEMAQKCRQNIATKISEIDSRKAIEAMRKAAAERKRQEEEKFNARLDSVKDVVVSLVREVRLHGVPPIVHLPHFDYQRGERAYACLHHAKWAEDPQPDSGWGMREEGDLIVTNQRVMFVSPQHRQSYRMKNIRDFTPNWHVSPGLIYVSSSERRREYYSVPSPWFASAVICILWNESFRGALMDGNEESAINRVWEKVLPSAKLFAMGLDDVNNVNASVNAEGIKEYCVNGKSYVDTSGLDFWEGLNAAFKAGYEGKDIITDWDKTSGKANAILRDVSKR